MNTTYRLKHSDLLYDYIKFHLGLYTATPPVLAIVAIALGVDENPLCRWGIAILVAIYFVAGIHASWSITSHVNVQWVDDSKWLSFGDQAHSLKRRVLHHYLYWAGLIAGLLGMVFAKLEI